MKYRRPLLLTLILLIFISISSCGQNGEIFGGIDSNISLAAQDPTATFTVEVIEISTSTSPPTSPPSPTIPPTEIILPSDTPAEAIIDTPKTSPSPIPPSCTNIAELDRHLSINEGSVLQPNTMYAKVWRVKNNGTCIWNTNYALTYTGENQSLQQADIPLANEVNPGETIELKVNFTTPEVGDTYVENFLLKSDTGMVFGVGSSADQPIALNYVIPPQSDLPPSC